ncbi:MAG: SOS response-associated peptidase [Flavobacteriales bacterium]
MCYDIDLLKARIARHMQRNDSTPRAILEAMAMLEKNWKGEPLFPVSGFEHPLLPLLVMDNELIKVQELSWGFIPRHTANIKDAHLLRKQLLNARSETMLEKLSFKNSALQKRCILPVAGYYEYHHKHNRVFPHYAFPTNDLVFYMACIAEEWTDMHTGEITNSFAICTCQANPLMARIHNNPKREGGRMPVMLEGDNLLRWLDMHITKDDILKMCQPLDDSKMKVHSVRAYRGKAANTNPDLVNVAFHYPELNEQRSLF